MIQTVVKRDGRIVGFNQEKIVSAIRMAMMHTEKGEDMSLISQIADRITFKGNPQMTVEAIQDMVELELMKSSRKDVARSILPIANSAVLPAMQRQRRSSRRSSISAQTM